MTYRRRQQVQTVTGTIRPAEPLDEGSICNLLEQMGYNTNSVDIDAPHLVLVAEVEEKVVGVLVLHMFPLFSEPGYAARIVILVVDEDHRGGGIGADLVQKAEHFAQLWNATCMEVTTGEQREGAHRFYESHGYKNWPRRYLKMLEDEV